MRKSVLSALALVVFIGPFGGNMVLPMFGALRRDLGASTLLLGLTITVYMVPFGVMQLFSGALSDTVLGRRTAIVAGLVVYSVGSLGSALAPSMVVMLLFRALQGLGNAFTTPIALAVAGDLSPRETRGRVLGLLSASSMLGVTLGPAIGGLVSAFSWRLGFVLLVVLALAAALLVAVTLPSAGGAGAVVRRGALYAVKRALLHRGVLAVSLTGFLVFTARTGLLTYLSDLLSLPPYSLGEPEIGGLLTLVGAGGILASPVWGFLADKIGRRRALLLGIALQAPLLAFFSTGLWYGFLAVLLFLYGFTIAAAMTVLATLAVEVLPQFRATASSVYSSFRFLGYAAAPLVFYGAYTSYLIEGVSLQALAIVAMAAIAYYTLASQARH